MRMIKKTETLCALLFIFFVMAFSSNNPDFNNYAPVYKYLSISDTISYPNIEIGFSILMKSVSVLGFNYQGFLMVLSLINTFLLYNFVRRYSYNPNIVLIMFIIFPYFIETVQIRNYLAAVIVLNAIIFLEKEKYVWFIVVILCAATIHTTAIFYLSFLLVFFDKRTIVKIVLFTTLIYLFFQKIFIEKFLTILPNGEKYARYTEVGKLSTTILFIVFFMVGLYLVMMLRENTVSLNLKFHYLDESELNMMDLIEKINIIIIFSFAFIAMDINFYRLYRNIIILNYILFSNTIYHNRILRNNSMILSQILFILFSLGTGYAFLYYNQYDSVVKTILESFNFDLFSNY